MIRLENIMEGLITAGKILKIEVGEQKFCLLWIIPYNNIAHYVEKKMK